MYSHALAFVPLPAYTLIPLGPFILTKSIYYIGQVKDNTLIGKSEWLLNWKTLIQSNVMIDDEIL